MRRLAVLSVVLGLGLFTLIAAVATRSVAVGAQDATPAADADANVALVRQFYEALNSGDLDALDAVLAPDFVDHNLVPGQAPGREGAKQALGEFLTAFPDFEVVNEDIIVEGDKVVVRSTARGTHTGDLSGMPPSGRPVELMAIDIWRVEGGQLVEAWHVEELLSMMMQIGAIPGMEAGPATPAATPSA